MITNIRLQNFRSYQDASFEFESGANIIVGPNASGKTNLLEAVMVLAQGNSYKSKDANLIKHQSDWARADGLFDSESRSLKLELVDDSLNKAYIINQKTYRRLKLEQTQPVVYFEPEHLQSITRGPEHRRAYLDDVLERSQPGYKSTLAAYRRTLAQRNSLLKAGRHLAKQQLFAWDVRLGELGSKIVAERRRLVTNLNGRISDTYSQIAQQKTQLLIDYVSPLPADNYAGQLITVLERNLDRDLVRGFTGYGPHREDLAFFINDRAISATASRGEIRSLLLSLKRLELDIIEQARSAKPILLLDDVFSELDGSRRQALVEMLKNHQSILTTTDADTVLDYFSSGQHHLLALS